MILIFGDSVGAGEWCVGNNDYPIVHGGLAQWFIEDGTTAVNLSVPASSNFQILQSMREFLRINIGLLDQVTHILVFQTDWVRDFYIETMYKLSDPLDHLYKDKVLYRFYDTLSKFSLKYNKPIYLIGGLVDIEKHDNFENDFPGVSIICHSSFNLVINQTEYRVDPTTAIFNERWVLDVLKKNSPDQLEMIIHEADKAHTRLVDFEKNPYYYAPDFFHGNREYHRVLFKFVKDKLNLKSCY